MHINILPPLPTQLPATPKPSHPEQEELLSSRALLLLMSLLMITLWSSYYLQRHKIRIIHESVVALLLGSVVGLIVRLSLGGSQLPHLLSFRHTYFFNLLLPPIILHSGYQLREGDFFGHLGPVATFAVLGTFTSVIAIGLTEYLLAVVGLSPLSFIDSLQFGCILSSTDPVTVLAIFSQLGVDARLYSILFGESLLNDSVAIVMFSALNEVKAAGTPLGFHLLGTFLGVFVGSLAIGVGIALSTALLLKHSDLYQFSGLEACLIALLSYTSFLVAQATGMSGIVSLLFAGITLKHYAYVNMSRRAQLTTTYLFSTLSQLSENFIFVYLGLTLFTTDITSFSFTMIVVTFIAILLARYVSVFPFAAMINAIGRRFRVTSGPAAHAGSLASALPESTPHTPVPSFHTRSWRNLWGLIPAAVPGPDVIPLNHQVMLWWAGLRGAVSFALALELSPGPVAGLIQSTTLVIVLMTVIIFGGTVPQALAYFNIKTQRLVDSVVVVDTRDGLPRLIRRNSSGNDLSSSDSHARQQWSAARERLSSADANSSSGTNRGESIPLFHAGLNRSSKGHLANDVEEDGESDQYSWDRPPSPANDTLGDQAHVWVDDLDPGQTGLQNSSTQRSSWPHTRSNVDGHSDLGPQETPNWFVRLDYLYLRPFFSVASPHRHSQRQED